MVVGGGLNRIWHLAPAFRAEKSDTNRHLNEFWMCEAELAFTEHLEDVMQVVEGLVKHLATSMYSQETMQKEMQDVLPEGYTIIQDLVRSKDQPWKRLRYSEAVTLLQVAVRDKKAVFQHPVDYSSGLKSEHERWLADQFGPTFVTDYPASQKPFYMRVNSSPSPNDHTVACFDLLVPRVGELAGGSLREERLEPLLRTMQERNMNVEEYEWYTDLRRYGSVKHGGFGLGWERLISWFTGIENIRECIAFPRGSEGSRY
jgi:asparaginyl-tRNA synthetase